MGILEKCSRLLNETELNDVHGGRAAGQPVKHWAAFCQVDGCGWLSGWSTSFDEVNQLMAAHEVETGHTGQVEIKSEMR